MPLAQLLSLRKGCFNMLTCTHDSKSVVQKRQIIVSPRLHRSRVAHLQPDSAVSCLSRENVSQRGKAQTLELFESRRRNKNKPNQFPIMLLRNLGNRGNSKNFNLHRWEVEGMGLPCCLGQDLEKTPCWFGDGLSPRTTTHVARPKPMLQLPPAATHSRLPAPPRRPTCRCQRNLACTQSMSGPCAG